MCFARDGHLITVDHWIPIGCNTFLWATRASSHDITTIKCSIKILLLVCKWSIQTLQEELVVMVTSKIRPRGSKILEVHFKISHFVASMVDTAVSGLGEANIMSE